MDFQVISLYPDVCAVDKLELILNFFKVPFQVIAENVPVATELERWGKN